MRLAIVIGCVMAGLFGCQSHRVYTDAVLRAPTYPRVILESVEATKDSPAHGYPIAPLPMPIYPFESARAGIEGLVLVRLMVDADGRVTDATIVRSSGREFEEPVLSATRRWIFRTVPEIPSSAPKGMILDCTIMFACGEEPNKAPEPTPMSVTSPAAQEPRQP